MECEKIEHLYCKKIACIPTNSDKICKIIPIKNAIKYLFFIKTNNAMPTEIYKIPSMNRSFPVGKTAMDSFPLYNLQ